MNLRDEFQKPTPKATENFIERMHFGFSESDTRIAEMFFCLENRLPFPDFTASKPANVAPTKYFKDGGK